MPTKTQIGDSLVLARKGRIAAVKECDQLREELLKGTAALRSANSIADSLRSLNDILLANRQKIQQSIVTAFAMKYPGCDPTRVTEPVSDALYDSTPDNEEVRLLKLIYSLCE